MESVVQVTVHESEYPEANVALLQKGLAERDLKSKFLYQSYAQTARWLQLHKAYSPAVLDPDCLGIYDAANCEVARRANEPLAHVVSLGCGGGTKDTELMKALRLAGKTVLYTPVDTSLAMVLSAQTEALKALRGLQSQPLVCDLPACSTLPAILKSFDPVGSQRIIGFLGMLHTFEPKEVLPRITNAVRSQDLLLLSVNLAPESRYREAMREILPQYNNELTREWLLGALLELGFSRSDGHIEVDVGSGYLKLERFEASFRIDRSCKISIGGASFGFEQGEKIRLFFSYRYTATAVAQTVEQFGFERVQQWISQSQEEGLFLCRRKT